jgi:hypothetical protein
LSDISALPGDIVLWLSGKEELDGIKFITEFPPNDKAVPLRKITVAVGLERVDIKDSFTENDSGVLTFNAYCREAKLRIRLAIHVPFALGGEKCHDAFADIVDCLTFASDLDILHSGCGDIRADRDTDALVLAAYIEIGADFCPAASSSLNFKSFLNKDLLCGSHIRDEGIHVTPDDKAAWNEPFITGGYFGNGAPSRSFDLGFKPGYVTIFATDCPPYRADFQREEIEFFTACAAGEVGSLGAEIKARGFKILNGPGQGTEGAIPRLNEPGISYFYIAVK